MIKYALPVTLALLFAVEANAAGVTYANCPTLAPLPVTNFMPGAMIPIKNTQLAFETGMNVTIKTAVTFAATTQLTSVTSSFNTLIENTIKLSRSQHEQEIQIEKQFERIKQAYHGHLTSQVQAAKNVAFPGDPAVNPNKPSADGSAAPPTVQNSPTMTFARSMCTMAKMNQYADSTESKDKVIRSVNRRNQKIVASIEAVSNVSMVAKQTVDLHYEMFCTQDEFNNALCDSASVAPNADLSAFNFLYPSGYRGDNPDFQTMYTYSPVESLAAYQYIRHITGNLYTTPPTETEKRDGTKVLFAGVHRQATSALSMASDVLLEITQLREPINKVGLPMSPMDVLSYHIEKSSDPNERRTATSASDSGKMLEIRKQMAVNNQLRLLLLKQKDAQRRLQAADISMSSTLESLR